MAADYRSHSSTTYASRTNTTITAPAGIVDGDVLVLFFLVGVAGTPPTPTLPSGFSVIQGPTTVSDSGFSVASRVAIKGASGESGDYTVTHSAASSQGVIVCVSDGDIAQVVSSANSGTNTTSTATGVTTPTNDSLVIFGAHNWDLYGTASPPAGTTPTFTERLDSATSLIYAATGPLATASATGNKSHANLNTFTTYPWAAWLVAVGASAGGGGASLVHRNLLLGVGT